MTLEDRCPACGSEEAVALTTNLNLCWIWVRCRHCGIDYKVDNFEALTETLI